MRSGGRLASIAMVALDMGQLGTHLGWARWSESRPPRLSRLGGAITKRKKEYLSRDRVAPVQAECSGALRSE